MTGRTTRAGYTLVELLVVLTIIVAVLAVAPPLFSRGLSSSELRAAARQIATGLRYAQSTAVSERREVLFTLDLDARRYRVAQRPPVQLPADLPLTLVTARSEVVGSGDASIRFYPDGSATGGRVTVGTAPNDYVVEVDWISGRVSFDHGA